MFQIPHFYYSIAVSKVWPQFAIKCVFLFKLIYHLFSIFHVGDETKRNNKLAAFFFLVSVSLHEHKQRSEVYTKAYIINYIVIRSEFALITERKFDSKTIERRRRRRKYSRGRRLKGSCTQK